MIIRSRANTRGAAVAVESAIVLPIALVVIFAIVAGALSIFTYQQVASLTREAARYASVHGYYHCQDTGSYPTTPADVYNNAILPYVVNIDPNRMTYSVSWSPDQKQNSFVTVTVTYLMSVPIYGDMTFTSTSTTVMTW